LKPIGAIDSPIEHELVYQHGFQVRGWVQTHDGRRWHAVVVRLGEHVVGATALPLARADVADALGQATADVGFIARCEIAECLRAPGPVELAFEVVDADGIWTPFATRRVDLSEIDYRIHGSAEVVKDVPPRVLTRADIYSSGPPSPSADPICTNILMQYLRAGDTVLDVGCGVGAYHHSLAPFGIEFASKFSNTSKPTSRSCATSRAYRAARRSFPFRISARFRSRRRSTPCRIICSNPITRTFSREEAFRRRYNRIFATSRRSSTVRSCS
jgi:hypothetical protein